MSKKITVLSTRKLQKNNLEIIKNSSLNWIQEDFISLEYAGFCIEELQDYLLFTSQNAILSVIHTEGEDFFKGKKVFCVGIKTKQMLEALGALVYSWAHYAEELSKQIIQSFREVRITFFNGNLRRTTLVDAFKKHGIFYQEIQVYKTVLQPISLKEPIQGLCFYSPSGVKSFLVNNSITDQVCFCIGHTTKLALEGITNNIVLASIPTVEQTIKACIAFYK
ncbi:uroporphyrinogen-III synthase [Myroides sp. LJL119]